MEDRTIGQGIKRKEKRRVLEVIYRLLEGTAAGLTMRLQATQGGGPLNTSYIERLIVIFRSRLGCRVRQTRSLARRQKLIHTGVYRISGGHS